MVEVASFTLDGELFKGLVNAMLVVNADFIQFTRDKVRVVSMDPSRIILLNLSLRPADYRCDVDSLWIETSADELERVGKKIKRKEIVRIAVVDDRFNVGSFEKVGRVVKEEDVPLLKEDVEGLANLEKSHVDAKLKVVLPVFRRIVKSAEATRLTDRWARHFEHLGLRVEEREGTVVFFSDRETYSKVDIKGFIDWVVDLDGRAKALFNMERFSSLLLLGLGEVATLEIRTRNLLRVNYAGDFWTVDFWLAPTVIKELMDDFEAILVVAKPFRKFVWRLTGESVKDFVKVLKAMAITTFDLVNMGGIGDTWWVYWKNGCAGFVKMDKYSFDEFISYERTAFGEFSLSEIISFLKDAEKIECFLEGEPTASLVLVASGAKIPTKEQKSGKLVEVVALPEVKGITLFSGSTDILTSICEDAITAKDDFLIFVSQPFEITVLGRNKIYYEASLPVDSFKSVEEDYVATREIEALRAFFVNIPAEIVSIGKEDYSIILEAQPRIAYVKTVIIQEAERLKEAIDFYAEYRKPPPPPKPTEITPLAPPPPERVSREEFMRAFDEALFEWIPHAIEGSKPGLSGNLYYEAPEFEAETLAKFSMDTVLSKWENVIAKEKEEAYRRYVEAITLERAKRLLAKVPELARNLAYSLVDKTGKQLFEEAKAKAKARIELPTEEIKRLRTVAKVKADLLGLKWSPQVWDAFWRDYQARARELWATRRISHLEEEVENVLRVVAPPKAPPKPPVRPPVEVPVEAPPKIFVEPTEPPKEPISPLPFPRSPTSEERERLWRAFMYEMSIINKDPYTWREAFRMYVLDRPYRFWADLLSNFRGFIEAVRTGREYRFISLATVPMPWRPEEKPEERKEDAITHFIATKLYPSMDELIYALRTYGVEATEQQIKEVAKKAYKEKNVWFTSVSRDFLESLIGEKLD